ncbi:MAG: nadC [Cyanobacteria bacterium RYN_339]|nr:nadC [Cyanobacteria bacterium RYN_339]
MAEALHADPLPPHPFLTEPLVRAALAEDLAWGDLSAWGAVGADVQATAQLQVKAPGVVAGLAIAAQVFALLDPGFRFEPLVADGVFVDPGVPIARLAGSARTLLSGERVALNFLQRMSGVATKTRAFVEALAGTQVQLVDTRKTTPGLRLLEKYAVRVGGGRNHRYGLADAVMIKDNHALLAGGITAAVANIRRVLPLTAKIEVETESLEMVREALAAGADIIMLDNMSLELMREAVALVAGRAILEASGNVTLDRVRAIAETGVDVISTGSVTHSAPALDISLDVLT